MQVFWLNKQNNDNLIVFFCGWSFDYNPFKGLACADYDVICVYDYTDIGIVLTHSISQSLNLDLLSTYKTTTLIGWSMGVYVAYIIKDMLPKFNRKIAINGTPYPIDDKYGIPIKTFDLTLKYVDSSLQGKFQKNLFKCPKYYEKYLENSVQRTIESQKAELIALNDCISKNKINYLKFYDYAIISDTDKIIPTRNQKDCWIKCQTSYTVLDSGHFPFFEFASWDDIIKCRQTLV